MLDVGGRGILKKNRKGGAVVNSGRGGVSRRGWLGGWVTGQLCHYHRFKKGAAGGKTCKAKRETGLWGCGILGGETTKNKGETGGLDHHWLHKDGLQGQKERRLTVGRKIKKKKSQCKKKGKGNFLNGKKISTKRVVPTEKKRRSLRAPGQEL